MKIRLIAGVLLSLAFGAVVAAADEAVKPAAVAGKADAQPDKPAVPPTCLQDTGSHIKPRPDECINAPGTSHSREEIDETGRRDDLGAALRQIDPRAH